MDQKYLPNFRVSEIPICLYVKTNQQNNIKTMKLFKIVNSRKNKTPRVYMISL